MLFGPVELLEKLAALTPRPDVHLLRSHGVLAPHARWRRQIVGFGKPASREPEARAPGRRPYWAWAALRRRAFGINVLCCPRWGELRLIATVQDPALVRKILVRLALALPAVCSGPARPLPPFAAGAPR